MRILALVLALAFATPALAQTDDDGPTPATQIDRASNMLAAIWRPITSTSAAAIAAACANAADDLSALDNSIPEDLSAQSLASVHVGRGLVFVPTADDPSNIFVFPDASISWMASGPAQITSADEETGEVVLQDAQDRTIHMLLGHVASQAMLRITTPGGEDITFVGCASTIGQPASPTGTPG